MAKNTDAILAQTSDVVAPNQDPYLMNLAKLLQAQQSPDKVSKSIMEQATLLAPEDYALAQIRANEDPNLQALKAQQDKIQELFGSYAPEPQTNLAPLAQYTSAITGKDFSSGYTPPPSTSDYTKMIAGLQDMIQKGQMGVTEAEMAFLKNQLTGKVAQSQESSTKKSGGKSDPMDKEFRKTLETYNKDISEIEGDLGLIENAIGTNDYAKLNNMKAIIARLMGEKGVLTEGDIQRIIPATFEGDLTKFTNYFASGNAKYDPALAKSLLEMVDLVKERTANKYKSQLQSSVDTYSSFGWSEGAAQAANKFSQRLNKYEQGIAKKKQGKEKIQNLMQKLIAE